MPPFLWLGEDELLCVVQKVNLADLGATAQSCTALRESVRRWCRELQEFDLKGKALDDVRCVGRGLHGNFPRLRRIMLPNGDGEIDAGRLRKVVANARLVGTVIGDPKSVKKGIELDDCDLGFNALNEEQEGAMWTVSDETWSAYCALLVPLARAHNIERIIVRCWEEPASFVDDEDNEAVP